MAKTLFIRSFGLSYLFIFFYILRKFLSKTLTRSALIISIHCTFDLKRRRPWRLIITTLTPLLFWRLPKVSFQTLPILSP